MIARGMSADEIVQVITASKGEAMDLPCASEVLVESDGNWQAALVLQAVNGEYYIHYLGSEMDNNEWVGPDRIRFPADSRVPRCSPSGTQRTRPPTACRVRGRSWMRFEGVEGRDGIGHLILKSLAGELSGNAQGVCGTKELDAAIVSD